MSRVESGTLVIGTRGSELALWQANHVRDRLLSLPGQPVERVELEIIKTRGDKILDVTLSKVGGKGLFVKELEVALLEGSVDLCVHSLKDMPAEVPPGTELAAFPTRADPRDAWVRPQGTEALSVHDLSAGSTVATSSLRRQAQLLMARPDLRVIPVRGNVGTRLAKLDRGEGGMEAMILACAGLRRLDLEHRITTELEPEVMLPAVGQGSLAIQCRSDDGPVRTLLGQLDDPANRVAIQAERAFLATLEGGCQVPIAAYAEVDDSSFYLRGLVASPDGTQVLRGERRGPWSEAAAAGRDLAEHLLGQGAQALIEAGLAAHNAEASG